MEQFLIREKNKFALHAFSTANKVIDCDAIAASQSENSAVGVCAVVVLA